MSDRRLPIVAGERLGPDRRRRRCRWPDRLVTGALASVLLALVGCGDSDGSSSVDGVDPSVWLLLDGVDLGKGWVDGRAREITPFPESIEPPCPTDPAMPYVDVADVVEDEIENATRRMGVNHTIATFEGDPGESAEVQAAWVRMDCSGSDFTQTVLEELPDGVDGIRLAADEGSLNQVLLIRHGPREVAFLIVSGDDDDPVDVARQLAGNFAASGPRTDD